MSVINSLNIAIRLHENKKTHKLSDLNILAIVASIHCKPPNCFLARNRNIIDCTPAVGTERVRFLTSVAEFENEECDNDLRKLKTFHRSSRSLARQAALGEFNISKIRVQFALAALCLAKKESDQFNVVNSIDALNIIQYDRDVIINTLNTFICLLYECKLYNIFELVKDFIRCLITMTYDTFTKTYRARIRHSLLYTDKYVLTIQSGYVCLQMYKCPAVTMVNGKIHVNGFIIHEGQITTAAAVYI